MKFVPRDPPPRSPRSVSPTTTTRYLRLTPAEDIPAAVPTPLGSPPVPEPPAETPAAPVSSTQSLRFDAETATAAVKPATAPLASPSKRLPNVFSSAPSFSATSSQTLRRVSISDLARPSKTSPLPEPSVPALGTRAPLSPEKSSEAEMPPSSVSEPVPTTPTLPTDEPTGPPAPPARLAEEENGSLGLGFWLLFAAFVIAAALFVWYLRATPKTAALHRSQTKPAIAGLRHVFYTSARLAQPKVELPLPGTIEAVQQMSIRPPAVGTVRELRADLGDVVAQGQVLAEIDLPDLEQQIAQAKTAAEQTRASLELAQNEADRWTAMARAHAVSEEDADKKSATAAGARAADATAQSALARLAALEAGREIRAPFAGKITARGVDVGGAVGPGAAEELFRLVQTDPLRIFLDVPEADAPAIAAGVRAKIAVDSYPGRTFPGEVVRDAGALTGAAHTLRTEVRIANPDGALLPGARAEVRLQISDPAPALLVSTDALAVTPGGVVVAIVAQGPGHDFIRTTSVHLGRTFGNEVEILDRVCEGDRLVLHPPSDLADGVEVIAEAPPTPSPVVQVAHDVTPTR